MNYKKYSDDDLMETYSTMLNYSGKATTEILNEINNRGGLEDFLKKSEFKKANHKEIARISKEVIELSNVHSDPKQIKKNISSDILSDEDLSYVVSLCYGRNQLTLADRAVNSKTILGSLAGILIGSMAGAIFWIAAIFFLKNLVYFPLIGVYLICYYLIKFFTKQSRNNPVVFISSVLATLASMFIVYLLADSFIINIAYRDCFIGSISA